MTDELTPSAFAEWAAAIGVEGGDEHRGLLYVEVKGLLGRVAALSGIDVSDVQPGEALLAPPVA